MKTLFLAWQNPKTRRWFPVGRLIREGGLYRFGYVEGAATAAREGEFEPLPSFPDLHQIYESEQLFPLFANRILSPKRPEYKEFLSWLGLTPDRAADPIELLARSGGMRVTDYLEIFSPPEADAAGIYRVQFFVHGLRYMPPGAVARTNELEAGERLLLTHDFQNPKDGRALLLRTCEKRQKDMYLVGYCPRYLFVDIFNSMVKDSSFPEITVERVNPPPAPIGFRLLCRAVLRVTDGVKPFSSATFQPLVDELVPAGI